MEEYVGNRKKFRIQIMAVKDLTNEKQRRTNGLYQKEGPKARYRMEEYW